MPPATNGTMRDLSTLAGRLGAAWDALRGASFSPGAPIAPTTSPEEQQAGARQWQYPIGNNTQTAPRGELSTLTPFEQLRNLCRLYPPAAICVRTRVEELQGATWSIVPKDKRRKLATQGRCDAVAEFWQQPDRQNEFASWLAMLLRDTMEIDALTLFVRRNRANRLYALEPIDGATIKPLLDDRGRVAAYQQVLYGLPFGQYSRGQTAQVLGEYSPKELIYRPRMPRTDSAYGMPPAEDIILTVNMGLRKLNSDLAHFTDGNIPAMLISPPEGRLDPQQVAEFEAYFNAVLAGSDSARARAKFLPWNANVKELNPFSYETTLDLWMLQLTFASFGVPPQEAGFTQDVNRATADAQENTNERRGLKPLATWLAGLFNRVIQAPIELGGMGQDDLEWQWSFGEQEDKTQLAQADKIYAEIGAVTAQEIRALRFGDTLDGEAPTPPTAPQRPGGKPGEAPAQPGAPFGKAAGGDEAPPALAALGEDASAVWARLYAAEAKRLIGRLRRQQPIDWAAEQQTIAAAAQPILAEAVRVALADAAQLVPSATIDWTMVNEGAADIAEARAQAWAAEATATTKRQIRQLIADGIRARTPQKLLLGQIQSTLGRRANVEAITEITRVYALANQRAWQASPAVTGLTWQTAVDDRVCLVCGPRHRRSLPIDSTQIPPAHYGCRCWITPEVRRRA